MQLEFVDTGVWRHGGETGFKFVFLAPALCYHSEFLPTCSFQLKPCVSNSVPSIEFYSAIMDHRLHTHVICYTYYKDILVILTVIFYLLWLFLFSTGRLQSGWSAKLCRQPAWTCSCTQTNDKLIIFYGFNYMRS